MVDRRPLINVLFVELLYDKYQDCSTPFDGDFVMKKYEKRVVISSMPERVSPEPGFVNNRKSSVNRPLVVWVWSSGYTQNENKNG